jgi:hypothetical protein
VSDVTLLPAWRNAAALIESGKWTFGDAISRAELIAAMGLTEPFGRLTSEQFNEWRLTLLSNVANLRDYLLSELSMDLATVAGDGFRIVHSHEQTRLAFDDGMREISRGLRKMRKRLHYVDHSRLTAEQSRENTDAITREAAIRSSLRKVVRELPAPPRRIKRERK